MKDIENKIEKDLANYQIKTRSEDILARLPQKKQKKKFSFKWLAIFSPVAAAVACCVLLFVIFNPFNNVNPNNPNKPHQGTALNQLTDTQTNVSKLSLQLFYGGAMVEALGYSQPNTELAGAYTDNDINSIVSKIEKSYSVINEMYSHQDGLVYSYVSTEFKYENVKYNYLLEVGEYKLYLDKDIKFDEDDDEEEELEWESDALIKYGDKYFDGNIEIEIEEDETSIELNYYDGDYTYSVAKDKEKKEYSIEYSVYYTDTLIETYEIELNYSSDKKFKCDYEYEKPEEKILIEIETIKNPAGYMFKYKEYNEDNIIYEIDDIVLEINENVRVYKLLGKEKHIQK